jgi:hypothetical protein
LLGTCFQKGANFMEYASQLARGHSLTAPETLAPVFVAGSSPAARQRALALVEAAGLRTAGAVSIGDALERLDQQARASAVWIELDQDEGAALDALLNTIDSRAGTLWPAIVSASPGLIDSVVARIGTGRVELLIDEGDDAARVAALAMALTPLNAGARDGGARSSGARLSDVATDNSAARLRQLTDEVGRIAATLARLSGGPAALPIALAVPRIQANDPPPEIAAETVRTVIRARRLRARFFDEELFADPAWDMLLDLTQAEIAQVRVPVSSLCIAAAVPATTALRWIKTLTDNGLLVRRADPHDGRRVFVEMAPTTSIAMKRYFAEVGRVAGI